MRTKRQQQFSTCAYGAKVRWAGGSQWGSVSCRSPLEAVAPATDSRQWGAGRAVRRLVCRWRRGRSASSRGEGAGSRAWRAAELLRDGTGRTGEHRAGWRGVGSGTVFRLGLGVLRWFSRLGQRSEWTPRWLRHSSCLRWGRGQPPRGQADVLPAGTRSRRSEWSGAWTLGRPAAVRDRGGRSHCLTGKLGH